MLQPKTVSATLAFYRAVTGNDIANRLNCHYDGVWEAYKGIPAMMAFTDNVTGSSLSGNSYEEVRGKLEVMRRKFSKSISGVNLPTNNLPSPNPFSGDSPDMPPDKGKLETMRKEFGR